jgi:hydrogenase maturation protein HypF
VFGDRLWQTNGVGSLEAFSDPERRIVRAALERRLNSPRTSSAGRLFDAVASLLGICQRSAFEGQAAMALEFAAEGYTEEARYPFQIVDRGSSTAVIDWAPMIRAMLRDRRAAVAVGSIAAMFHNTLADAIVDVAKRCGERRVVLTGGCFQNRLLAERSIVRLKLEGFVPYWPRRVPPNDGGIALGQIAAAMFASERSAGSDVSGGAG